ncbi:MAG: TetR/AcrR family transcriptional regulator [Chelatococcus sp.]|nr:MAG: TetR/AcrR family transcriptional regulator [Chelatococcus sp.]
MDNERPGQAGGGMGSRTRGRPKQSSDEAQRERIVAGARDLFLEIGYAATTMDMVATRCGVSKRTLYRLFPAKLGLFQAMVADHRRSMLALPRPEDDLPLDAALAAIFRLDSGEAVNRARLAFIRLVTTEGERSPDLREAVMSEAALPSLNMLADWIAQQRERGRIEVPDARAAARMLMDMAFGGFVERLPEDRLRTVDDSVLHARRAIAVFLHGVMPGQGAMPGRRR